MKLRGKAMNFFTSRKEYAMAKEAGISMEDSYFVLVAATDEIITREDMNREASVYQEDLTEGVDYFPIYTLSEILFKLPEWVEGGPYKGSIKYLKDAPFYGFCLYTPTDKDDTRTEADIDARIECFDEYPIRSAMQMLIECGRNKDLWYVQDISSK